LKEEEHASGGNDLSKTPDGNKQLFKDRTRTNLFRAAEQKLISILIKRVPGYVTSDMLTYTGMGGSAIVLTAFLLGHYAHPAYLLLGIAGLAINWLGDSLDGRLAYYRNSPRKWYGFALDIIVDWAGIVFIGLGYMVYAAGAAEILAFLFVVLYGWAMIISQLRYKITDKYSIDSGLVGPTELRVIISLVLVAEVIFKGSITWFAGAISLVLLFVNLADTRKLLQSGDFRDQAEKRVI